MKLSFRFPMMMTTCLGAAVFMLLSTAWFQIQAVRWGYRVQGLQSQLDDLQKKEQSVDQRLQGALSLSRLDELAKTRFRLKVPEPSQIVIVFDI